jgi:hypothetical protein
MEHEVDQADWLIAGLIEEGAQGRAPRGDHQGRPTVVPIHRAVARHGPKTRPSVTIGGPDSPHAQVTEFGGTIPRRAPRGEAGIQARQVGYARRARRSFASVGVTRVTKVTAQPYLYPTISALIRQDKDLEAVAVAADKALRNAFPTGRL